MTAWGITVAQINAAMADLRGRLSQCRTAGAEIDVVKRWCAEIENAYDAADAEWAVNVLDGHRLRTGAATYIKTLNILAEGDVIADFSQKSEGDMIGVVGGIGNQATFGDINIYKNRIEKSQISPDLKAALVDARAGIERLELAEALKVALASEFEKFSLEVEKPTPDKGMLSKAWSGMIAVAKGVPAIATVAKLVGKLYGIELPIP